MGRGHRHERAGDAAQQEVERTATEYDQAISRIGDLNQQIADNEARIAEIEETLPTQQERSSAAAVKLYKTQASTPGLLEMVLSSENIVDFFTSLEYVSHIYSSNQAEIKRLSELKDELDQTKRGLSQAKKDARRRGSQRRAGAFRRPSRRARRPSAKRRRKRPARPKRPQRLLKPRHQRPKPLRRRTSRSRPIPPALRLPAEAAGGSSAGTVEAPSDDGADWASERDVFVAQWTGRIDAYLAGSPMAGTGKVFAEAAWDYGVDPRWSPAISNTESSKGVLLPGSCNAWGWGGAAGEAGKRPSATTWPGLARGYGYTISVDAAKRYCPPNWEHWYNATLAQMNMI